MKPDPGECPSCGAPVYWAHTRKGNRMPVDVEPHPSGNCFPFYNPHRREIRVEVRGKHDYSDDSKGYRPHFATCGNWKRDEQTDELEAGPDKARFVEWFKETADRGGFLRRELIEASKAQGEGLSRVSEPYQGSGLVWRQVGPRRWLLDGASAKMVREIFGVH